MSGYIDGPVSFANAYLTDNVRSFPVTWPNNSNTAEYRLTYVVANANYVSAALGTTNASLPNTAVLVEKSPVERIGANVLRYTMVYQEPPVTWTERQEIVYAYPGLSAINTIVANVFVTYSRYGLREPISVPKLATVTREYVVSNTFPVANISNVTIVTFANNPVDYIGSDSYYSAIVANTYTTPSTDPTTWTVSSTARLWKFPIWEVTTINVSGPNTYL
jgi:hypothetical protein